MLGRKTAAQSNARPCLAIVLGLLLAALIACGVTVVLTEAQRQATRRMEKMSEEASQRAYELTDAFRLSGPAMRLALGYAARNPGPGVNTSNEGVLSRNFASVMRDWRAIAPYDILTRLTFNFQGAGAVASSPADAVATYSQDRLLNPGPGTAFQVVSYMLRTGQAYTTSNVANSTRSLFTTTMAAFASATSANETWGWPSNATAQACLDGTAPCFNATAGTKWWGFVSFAFGRPEVEASPPMQSLRASGYGYVVSMRQDPPGLGLPQHTQRVALFRNVGGNTSQSCSGSDMAESSKTVDMYNLEITVQLCMLDSVVVPWRAPLIAVVVVVSVLVIAATGWVAFTWLRHSELLHALLPAPAVQEVSRALMQSKHGSRIVGAESPADKLISLLGDLLAHQQPDARDVVELLAALKQRHNLYVPHDLRAQLALAAGNDREVAAALMATVAPIPLLPRSTSQSPESMMNGDDEDNRAASNLMMSSRPEDFRDVLKALMRDPGTLLRKSRTLAGSRLTLPAVKAVSQLPDSTDTTVHNNSTNSGHINSSSVLPIASGLTFPGSFIMAIANASTARRTLSASCSLPDQPKRSCDEEELDEVGSDDLITTFAQAAGGAVAAGGAQGTGAPNSAALVQLQLRHCEAPGTPGPAIVTRLERVLMGSLNLDGTFDALELADAAHGHPLAVLGYWVFMQSGLTQALRLPQDKLIGYLHAVEAGYDKQNPYHSAVHAADVLQSAHALLHTGGFRAKYANSNNMMLACYLAALVHDYEHRGVTNDFLINVRDELALRYNDKSPHENHHVSAAFRLLGQDKFNFTAGLPQADFNFLRKMTIELVLATDMRQHFSLNGAFASTHRLATAQGVDRVVKHYGPAQPAQPAAPAARPTAAPTAAVRSQRTSSPALRLPFGILNSGGSKSSHSQANDAAVEVDDAGVHVAAAAGSTTNRGAAVLSTNSSLELPRGSATSATGDGQHSSRNTTGHHTVLTFTRNSKQGEPKPAAAAGASQPGPAAVGPGSGHRTASRIQKEGSPELDLGTPRYPGASAADCPGPQDDADRLLSLQVMLKCCDLGHVAASLPIHLKWVKALEEEMFKQGDREKALGLTVSPLCNREHGGVTQSQVGFFTAVCLPLFVNLSLRFPATAPMLEAVGRNFRHWSVGCKEQQGK